MSERYRKLEEIRIRDPHSENVSASAGGLKPLVFDGKQLYQPYFEAEGHPPPIFFWSLEPADRSNFVTKVGTSSLLMRWKLPLISSPSPWQGDQLWRPEHCCLLQFSAKLEDVIEKWMGTLSILLQTGVPDSPEHSGLHRKSTARRSYCHAFATSTLLPIGLWSAHSPWDSGSGKRRLILRQTYISLDQVTPESFEKKKGYQPFEKKSQFHTHPAAFTQASWMVKLKNWWLTLSNRDKNIDSQNSGSV